MEEVKTISDLAQLGAGVAMGFGAIGVNHNCCLIRLQYDFLQLQ